MYPTSNMYDIPTLLPELQGRPEDLAPLLPWGAVSRGTRMPGTWCFYVDDYRFSALLKRPEGLPPCAAAVEPNITVYEQSPRWESLAAIGRKRTIARSWQTRGVRIWVDLNHPVRYASDALLGVPREWRAFATRGYAQRLEDLRDDHAMAVDHCRGAMLVVYGGGRPVEELCRQLPGAIYIPSHRPAGKNVTAS